MKPTTSLLKSPHNAIQNYSLSETNKLKGNPEFSKSGHLLHQSSMRGVFWNYINALVGAGILGIPFVYQSAGIIGGIALMFFFALLCTYTLNILIDAGIKYKVQDYEALGYEAFGTTGYLAAAFCILLLDFGSMLNYLIILGDASFKVIEIWGFDEYTDRQLVIIIISVGIIFPPCLFRSIAMYEKFSVVKLIAIGTVIAVIIYEWISHRFLMNYEDQGYINKYAPPSSDFVWFNMSGIPSAMGIVAYCFVAHDTAFLYYKTLSNPTTLRWSELSFISIGCAMLLSIVLSVPAYLTFGQRVDGNILDNYEVKAIVIIITRLVYVLTMALTYPTAFFVVREVIYHGIMRLYSSIQVLMYTRRLKKAKRTMLYSEYHIDIEDYRQQLHSLEYDVHSSPLWHHLLVTFCLFFCNLTLALFIDNLGVSMEIIGSLSSVNLAFVLPCMCHLRVSEFGLLSWMNQPTMKSKLNAFVSIYPPICITLFGIFIAIYGVYTAVSVPPPT